MLIDRLKNIFTKRVVSKPSAKHYDRDERKVILSQGDLANKLLKNKNFNEFVELFYLENTLTQDRMTPMEGEPHSEFESRVTAMGNKRQGAFEFRNFLKAFVARAAKMKKYIADENKQKVK